MVTERGLRLLVSYVWTDNSGYGSFFFSLGKAELGVFVDMSISSVHSCNFDFFEEYVFILVVFTLYATPRILISTRLYDPLTVERRVGYIRWMKKKRRGKGKAILLISYALSPSPLPLNLSPPSNTYHITLATFSVLVLPPLQQRGSEKKEKTPLKNPLKGKVEQTKQPVRRAS